MEYFQSKLALDVFATPLCSVWRRTVMTDVDGQGQQMNEDRHCAPSTTPVNWLLVNGDERLSWINAAKLELVGCGEKTLSLRHKDMPEDDLLLDNTASNTSTM